MSLPLVAAVAAGLSSELAVAELIARSGLVSAEAARKLTHMIGGTTIAGLPLAIGRSEIAFLALLFVPLMVISRRWNWLPVINSAERVTFGETFYPCGVLFAALTAATPWQFAFGVLIMAIPDALAALVGQRWGRHRFRAWGAIKSSEGSAVFFITALVLTLLSSDVRRGAGHLAVAAPIAACLTVVEAALGFGLDNLVLPPAAVGLARLAGIG